MIISTVEELRLYSPANAIDHFDTLAGFLDSSEHDFLAEKLGADLHSSLTSYYADIRDAENGIDTFISAVTTGDGLTPYARLLSVCQRAVTYDALARAIDVQAVSVNGSGVNMSVGDDYPKADREAVIAYKSQCNKEAHAAINRLLQLLEEWCKQSNAQASSSSSAPVSSDSSLDSDASERQEIASLWQSSRYYFLAAQLILPSAAIVQEYLNIYDSRERYITMLPDLRYIQEDVLAPVIGEDLLDALVMIATAGTSDRLLSRIIHKLRKACARHLESRTMALKTDNPRRETARNEAIMLTTDLTQYIKDHQQDIIDLCDDAQASASSSSSPSWASTLLSALKHSPLYVAPATTTTPVSSDSSLDSDTEGSWRNNAPGSHMFVTPSL